MIKERMTRVREQAIIFLLALIWLAPSTIKAQVAAKILVDADTANEVDDLFALSKVLMEPSVEVTALNAAQWQASHWATQNTMEDSHRLNQTLLGMMGIDRKTNRGAVARMYDWGDRAQHSAAAYEIIKQTKVMKEGEQLTIIALGALTNVASAVFIEPNIASKIRLYWLGTTYDFDTGVLLKNDFNCAMDQYAITHLLFSEVEMHIMPVNIASKMKFNYKDTERELSGHFLGEYLLKIWDDHIDGGRVARTIWDLAIIDAFLHPEWAEEVEITTSKDNGNRKVFFYRDFDADKMREEFFKNISAYQRP